MDKEAKLVMVREKASKDIRDRGEEVTGVGYAGNERYGKHRTLTAGVPTTNAPQSWHPLNISGYFNCDEPPQMLRKCPLPRNKAQSSDHKLEYFNKKNTANGVHLVLAEICNQLDCDTKGTAYPNGDADIISSLIEGVTRTIKPTKCIDDPLKQEDEENDADIFFVEINLDIGTGDQFEWACMDSGAQRSIIGIRKARMYSNQSKGDLAPSQNGQNYKFCNDRAQGLGTLVVRMPVSESHVVDVAAGAVNVDVLFLLGLYVMTRLKMVIYFDQDIVQSRAGGGKQLSRGSWGTRT